MKIIKSLFCLSFIFCALTVSAANYSWQFAGWHAGGCFPNLAFDPHNKGRVYLTSDVGGIFRSDDLGEHWYFVTKGLGNLVVSQVAVAPSDSNILYAATRAGLFVSKDAAASWQAADRAGKKIAFHRPYNYKPIAIDPENPASLCVGTAGGSLFCSNDFGASWKELDPERKVLTVKKTITAVTFDTKGRVFASAKNGFVRCAKDGSSCEFLKGPENVTDFVFSQKKPGTIYAAGAKKLWISPDEGASWTESQPIAKGKTYRVVLDESGPAPIIWVAWNQNWKGGVIFSQDGGQTWEKPKNTMHGDEVSDPTRVWADKNGKITGLFIYPFNPSVLFRTDWWGVWRTHDKGINWYERIIGTPNTVATQVAVASNGDLYVASMDNGLLRSRDGGKTYEILFPTKYDVSRSGHVWRVAVAGDTIIGTSSPWDDRVNQVIRSTDGGKKFDLIRNGIPTARPKSNTMWGEGYPRALAVDPKNPDTIYLGIDGDDGGGLYVSRDRGRSWKRSPGQPGALRIYNALAVDPTNTQRIIWGANAKKGGIYISEDGGKSFDHVFKQMSWVFDVKVASDGTMYAAGDSLGPKLYVSTNHGRKWKLGGEFGPAGQALGTVAVDPKNSKRVAVSTVQWDNGAPGKIYLSTNGGTSWTDITGDLPDGTGASSMAFDPKGNYLYITRYAGSVYKMKL